MFGKKKKPNEIRLCPSCKQPTLRQATNVSGWLDSPLFQCSDKDCGYSGRFYIVVDADEIRKGDKGQDDDADKEDEENNDG